MPTTVPTVKLTEFLGGMPPGEVRCYLAQRGLGGRHSDAPPTLAGPAGPVPRAAVRHVALEVALWEGGRNDPTAAELAKEAGLELSTTKAALVILARLTGHRVVA